MPYSLDLRERVVNFVEEGGSVSKAAQLYKVSRATIYRWLGREDLKPTQVKRRKRKLDWEALKKEVEQNPDIKLAELAQKFGVRINAISYALKEMKINRKKRFRYQGKNSMVSPPSSDPLAYPQNPSSPTNRTTP